MPFGIPNSHKSGFNNFNPFLNPQYGHLLNAFLRWGIPDKKPYFHIPCGQHAPLSALPSEILSTSSFLNFLGIGILPLQSFPSGFCSTSSLNGQSL